MIGLPALVAALLVFMVVMIGLFCWKRLQDQREDPSGGQDTSQLLVHFRFVITSKLPYLRTAESELR